MLWGRESSKHLIKKVLNISIKWSIIHFIYAKCSNIQSPTFQVGKVSISLTNVAVHSRFTSCTLDLVDPLMTKRVRPLLRSHSVQTVQTGQKLSLFFKLQYLPHILAKWNVSYIKTYLLKPRIPFLLTVQPREEVITNLCSQLSCWF